MQIVLRPLPDIVTLEKLRRFRVADVLKLPSLDGARVIAGEDGLDRLVTHVNVMQIPTGQFAVAGDLVLVADETFGRSATDPGELLATLDERHVAAVAARSCGLTGVRDALATMAAERQLPLIELPDHAHLSELLGSTLEALIASQATELRQAAVIRGQMAAFALAGGELDELPDAVAELASGDIAIVADDGEVLASSTGWDDRNVAETMAQAWLAWEDQGPALADNGFVIWPLVTGAVRVGCMVARPRSSIEPVRLAALEYGSNIAALGILHRREAARAETQLRKQFVADLTSGALDIDAATRRSIALGWKPEDRFVVIVARGRETSASALVEVAQAADGECVAIERQRACLAILASAEHTERAAARLIAALASAGGDVHVGASAPLASIGKLPRGVLEAEEALGGAEIFNARTRVRRQSELGVLRMLAEAPRWELEAFVQETLAPLDAIEPDGTGPLTATLRGLLETGLNLAETARNGGWHYNTARYRVERLTQLLGPFREEGTRLQTLSVALLLRRELGVRSHGAAAGTPAGFDEIQRPDGAVGEVESPQPLRRAG